MTYLQVWGTPNRPKRALRQKGMAVARLLPIEWPSLQDTRTLQADRRSIAAREKREQYYNYCIDWHM